ncbi:DUF5682 family protein [Galactobacter sp.]|mgnify:CR=1 FL=1|uniref:DUF5682 family protein n=1 Tax=Galactobacter sp. TaxID=2676125 RepID=UPI0025C09FC6|nr:DUF5682 family protein [Galactobacter sp.]
MSVVFVPVRHHSPACAGEVEAVIRRLRPRHVLVEGPADFNGRIDELFLDHELPIAVYTGFHTADRLHASWAPLCEYSPEWVALNTGRVCGAQLHFIDLPVWHPALFEETEAHDSEPAPADRRYARVRQHLAERFHTDDVDALWDHVFELPDFTASEAAPDTASEAGADSLALRLDTWFTGLRGDTAADPADTAREAYMAEWIRAARAEAAQAKDAQGQSATGDDIVVVTGGFHMPALRRLIAESAPQAEGELAWPEIPSPPADVDPPRSYLVPFSFRRLDSLAGYRSGMPSPAYYQRLFESGPRAAAEYLQIQVATRLRERHQAVSTPDLTAARVMAESLARLRGNPVPARVDVLDGLASALLKTALDAPLPWARRSSLAPATDPVVVEMVAALSGDRAGRLDPHTPLPPLWHDVDAQLQALHLSPGTHSLSLVDSDDLERSRLLHRLRILHIAQIDRVDGPLTALDPELTEVWELGERVLAGPSVIEASGFGPSVADASLAALSARLGEASAEAGPDLSLTAEVLFDAVLCGHAGLTDELLELVSRAIGTSADLQGLARVLETALGLWRNGGYLGAAGSVRLAGTARACVPRILWLAEAVRGDDDAEPAVHALAGVRDVVLTAGRLNHGAQEEQAASREAVLAVAHRLAASPAAPIRVRGAGLGLAWALGQAPEDPARMIRGAGLPQELGDFLSGLFALARDESLASPEVVRVVDQVVCGFDAQAFLIALPALREAFALFPPRERERIGRLAARLHGRDDPRAVALGADSGISPELRARAAAVQERARALLGAAGLLGEEEAGDGR